MHGFFRGLLACVFLLLNTLLTPAFAQEAAKQPGFFDGFNPDQMSGDHIHAMFSPYSFHYSGDDGHQYVWLVGAERERQDGTLAGLAFFSNSFGQHTFYYYPWGGIVKNVVGIDNLFVKWTAGMLYGYVAPYEDKVPFNYKGFSLGVIPAVGWRFDGGNQVQVNVFGGAGFMLQFSAQIK
ncbi:MAG: hypothetical protein WBJ21_06295 [Burkholderiaceae bacterium]|jgi:hypothetical protein